MPTGVTGSFDLSGSNGITARVIYTETYDIVSNTSSLSLNLQFKSSSYLGTYYINGPLTVDGSNLISFSSYAGSHYVQISSRNSFSGVVAASSSYKSPPWVKSGIVHESDGSRSITISLSVSAFVAGGSSIAWSVSGSKPISLTNIPRASTIGATAANIGERSSISISKKSDNYTHSIAYKFGSLSGYITSSGGTSSTESKFSANSLSFLVPTAFFEQIPNAQSGLCTLTCRTYSGSTKIGDDQTCTFRATASKLDCAPLVYGSVEDSNQDTIDLTGDSDVIVKYHSFAHCTISVDLRNSAKIKRRTISGVTVPETKNDCTIENTETGNFEFVAVDSREYDGRQTVQKELVEYIPLTCNPAVSRDGPTTGNAILTIEGQCFNGSFGAVDNTLSVSYRVRERYGELGDPVSIQPDISGNKWTVETVISGLTYTSVWEIEITAQDKLETVTKTVTVLKGVPVFDWGENDFVFHVPIQAPNCFVWKGAQRSDMNVLTTQGSYLILENTPNFPIQDGIALVFGSEGTYTLQMAFSWNAGVRKIRVKWWDLPWGAWQDL